MDYSAALKIAYPYRIDRTQDDYRETLRRLMADLQATRQGRNTLLEDDAVSDKLDSFLACLLNSRLGCSVQESMAELHTALVVAAAKEAGRQYQHIVDELLEVA